MKQGSTHSGTPWAPLVPDSRPALFHEARRRERRTHMSYPRTYGRGGSVNPALVGLTV